MPKYLHSCTTGCILVVSITSYAKIYQTFFPAATATYSSGGDVDRAFAVGIIYVMSQLNHNIKPIEYFAVRPEDEILISRSFKHIQEAGTHALPVYTSLEQELKFIPDSIVAIWKRKQPKPIQ